MDERDKLAALQGNTAERRRQLDQMDEVILRNTWDAIDRSRVLLARINASPELLWRGLFR